MKKITTIIVGSGPAGLAIAGRFAHLGIDDYLILESSDHFGNAWRHHYDRLHLHTVKQWSHLPHLPFPDDYPIYVPREKVVEYLEHYTKRFDIEPKYQQKVVDVSRTEDGWQVSTDSEKFIAKHVVIATGVNNIPKIPTWPGKELFKGDITHSRYYKNPEKYKNKKVLIIGMGNTGAELAYDLADHGVNVYLSVRSPISLVPRDLSGRPVQVTARQLAKLPFGLGDWLGSQIRKIYFGNLDKYGLPISKMHPAVQLRETGKTPVIDIGTIAAIKDGRIKVIQDIKSFDKDSIYTKDGKNISVDSVILATGYHAALETIIPGIASFLDDNGLPKRPIASGDFSQLYFIGFDNYKLGGILGTINDDSESIVRKINSLN